MHTLAPGLLVLFFLRFVVLRWAIGYWRGRESGA